MIALAEPTVRVAVIISLGMHSPLQERRISVVFDTAVMTEPWYTTCPMAPGMKARTTGGVVCANTADMRLRRKENRRISRVIVV